jgi:hypothetical protein
VSRPVAPPSGSPPPETATLAGRLIALVPLAEATADRYFHEFPGDLARYGAAARDWEIHDTLYCLYWAVLDVGQAASLEDEIGWLANVLGSRGFPLAQLARNLDLAASVVAESLAADGTAVAERLRAGAATVSGAAK